jgi:hypothetical protein
MGWKETLNGHQAALETIHIGLINILIVSRLIALFITQMASTQRTASFYNVALALQERSLCLGDHVPLPRWVFMGIFACT